MHQTERAAWVLSFAHVRHGGDYQAEANDVVACIPMIETRQAVESVDEILDVTGVDAVYIGPNDLSLSYGLAPSLDNEGDTFDSALARVVEACARHGVVPGVHANSSLAAKRHAEGFRMITVGSDAASAIAALARRRGGGAGHRQSRRQRVTPPGNRLSDHAYTVAGRSDQNGRNDGSGARACSTPVVG